MSRELEAFSYSVAHDRATQGIDGFSLALLEDWRRSADEQGKDYPIVRASAQRMAQSSKPLLLSSDPERACREVRPRQPGLRHDPAPPRAGADAEVESPSLTLLARRSAAPVDPPRQPARQRFEIHRAQRPAHIEFGKEQVGPTVEYFVRDDGGLRHELRVEALRPPAPPQLHAPVRGIGIGLATVQRIVHRPR